MTCIDSIDDLITRLQTLLAANSDTCCQELLMPTDIATYTTAITTTCTITESSITSAVSDRAYRLHNFDIPIHTFCDCVFRSAVMEVSTIPKSELWRSHFENTAITPPRIDTLSPTSTDEYYLLLAWTTLFQNYVRTAQMVNRNDAAMIDMAQQALANDEQFFRDQLDTLHRDQSCEDALQDIVDDPSGCKELYVQERQQHARERLQAKKRSQRCAMKKQTMCVPLNRTAMQRYEHALVDSRFNQEKREWQRKLDDIRVHVQNVEQKRLLGETIGAVLGKAGASLNRLSQLIQTFLQEWQQHTQMCGTGAEPPLMRRMTFQQQLKTTLFDLRALMSEQRTNDLALCENRCGSTAVYYSFFNYSTSSCYVPTTRTTSDTVVLDATMTLQAYTTEQRVLREVGKATLQSDAVVTKNDVYCVVERLVRWRYNLLLSTS